MVASAVDTSVTAAAFAILAQRHRYRKMASGEASSVDDVTRQLAEALDFWEGVIEDLVSRMPQNDGSGGLETEYVKSATGTVYVYFRTVAGADTANDKRIAFNASEGLDFEHWTGAAWVSCFRVVDATDVRLGATSPEFALGSGDGSPSQLFIKSAAGDTEVAFHVNSFTPVDGSKRLYYDANENLRVQSHDGTEWQEQAGFIHSYTATVLFSDLGSGASDSIALPSFPTGVQVVGIQAYCPTEFTGEADLTFIVGDTANDDELIEATALHETGDNIKIAHAAGTYTFMTYEADYTTAGLAIGFAATELDDVTAGELRVKIHYIEGTGL